MSDLSDAVRNGDTLTALAAVRDGISADLETCESYRDRAALYLRLTAVLTAIEELTPPRVEGDTIDQIAQRRAARTGSTATAAATRRTRR